MVEEGGVRVDLGERDVEQADVQKPSRGPPCDVSVSPYVSPMVTGGDCNTRHLLRK
jgi:hypothetical protein